MIKILGTLIFILSLTTSRAIANSLSFTTEDMLKSSYYLCKTNTPAFAVISFSKNQKSGLIGFHLSRFINHDPYEFFEGIPESVKKSKDIIAKVESEIQKVIDSEEIEEDIKKERLKQLQKLLVRIKSNFDERIEDLIGDEQTFFKLSLDDHSSLIHVENEKVGQSFSTFVFNNGTSANIHYDWTQDIFSLSLKVHSQFESQVDFPSCKNLML